jgi:hypothetical protein
MADGEVVQGTATVAVTDVEEPMVSGATVAAETACRSASALASWVNSTNNVIWEYEMTQTWCYDGNRVTNIFDPAQISGVVYGWASLLGWSYEGTLSQTVNDFYGDQWAYPSYAEGSFKLCPPRVLCFLEETPTIWLHSYADGRFDVIVPDRWS